MKRAGLLLSKSMSKRILADNSEDEKRIKNAQEKASRTKKQMESSIKKPWIDRASFTATIPGSNDDRQLFRVNVSR